MFAASLVVNKYFSLFRMCEGNARKLGRSVPMPIFSKEILKNLCKEFLIMNAQPKPILRIYPDRINVVGDIHGNIHNLFQIFEVFGYPPFEKFLFLGNVIDFGEYSLEVITLIIALQVCYPESIYLIKGITEASSLNVYRGLRADIVGVYQNSSIHELFLQVFTKLPIGILIYDDIFCSQPYWISEYKSIHNMESQVENNQILCEIDAYNYFTNAFSKIDDASLRCLKKADRMSYILLGCCPIGEIFNTYENVIYCSASNFSKGCIIPLISGEDNEIALFDTYDELDRKNCVFKVVTDCTSMCKSSRKICIPHVWKGIKMKRISSQVWDDKTTFLHDLDAEMNLLEANII